MKQKCINKITSDHLLFALMVILSAAGILLGARTIVWARRAVYEEHDKHLSALASTVDHNIAVVFDRCRLEFSALVESEKFQENEKTMDRTGDSSHLSCSLAESSVLLTDYAVRIIVRRGDEVILSTREGDRLHYVFFSDNDGDDVWLCVDADRAKSYVALSHPSEVNDNVYFVLLDMEQFFRQVVVDTIYEDYWIVLFDIESGLAMQNDATQPGYRFFSRDQILRRNDGYSRIYEQICKGESGAASYTYTNKKKESQESRIYVIPGSNSENGVLSVAVASYNEHVSAPVRSITVNSILAAILVAFSIGTMFFITLQNGKKQKEQAEEIKVLEKERELKEDLLHKQEELVHHQKLETIGTLTAGIAHEFNNLLTPIMGNSMLIMEKSRIADDEIFNNALEIYTASDRAKNLIPKISKLSRKQSVAQMSPIVPEKLITGVLEVSASSIPGNIAVNKVINTDRQFLGDEGQLGHMLLNLVINAVQAMSPEGGVLTVSADADSENVYISVADTGKGIPEEKLEKIFDPFFTTKEPGKGTGLGLSIAQNTAANHGGTITAENLPEGGARFTFTVHIFEQ